MRQFRAIANSRTVQALVVVVAFALGGCSSSDSSRDSARPTIRPAASGGGGAVTTSGAVATSIDVAAEAATAEVLDSAVIATPVVGNPISGTWTADAGDLLAAGSGGGIEGVSCAGLITLIFFEDGTFRQNGAADCSLRDQTGTLEVFELGQYSLDGTTITVTNVESEGSDFTISGVVVPLTLGLAIGNASYSVTGDTLRITSGTRVSVTQAYTRSGS